MKAKGILIRKCIGCNERKNKNELIRICRTTSNSVEIDLTYKMEGRGAYICNNNLTCLNDSIKFNKISRVLKVEIPSEIVTELQKRIDKF